MILINRCDDDSGPPPGSHGPTPSGAAELSKGKANPGLAGHHKIKVN